MTVSDNTMIALEHSVLKLYRKDTTLFPNLQAFSGIFSRMIWNKAYVRFV